MNRVLALLLCAMLATTAYAGTELHWGKANRVPQSGTARTAPVNVPVTGGVNPADTTGVPFQFDGRSLYTAEQFPDRNYQLIQPSVLSSTFLHITGAQPSGTVTADSSGVIDVSGYNRLALLVYPTCDDSTWAALVAFRWQFHTSAVADSQSTYIEQPWNRFRGVATVSADSMVSRPDSIGTLMPRERNLANSTGGNGIAANDKLAMLGENVLVVNDCASNKRGRIIYLTNKDGQPVSGKFMSLYWRHLVTYLNTATGAFSQATNATELRLRLRADLIGWR